MVFNKMRFGHLLVGAGVWVLCILLVSFSSSSISSIELGMIAGLVTCGAFFLHQREVGILKTKMKTDTTKMLSVLVNEIQVGTISGAEYARFCLEPLLEWRVHIRQIVNLIHGTLSASIKAFISLPIILFCTVLLCGIYAPADLIHNINALTALSPEALSGGIISILRIFIPTIIFAYGLVGAITGYPFGLQDEFSAATATAIRRHLRITTEGRMSISSFEIRDTATSAAN